MYLLSIVEPSKTTTLLFKSREKAIKRVAEIEIIHSDCSIYNDLTVFWGNTSSYAYINKIEFSDMPDSFSQERFDDHLDMLLTEMSTHYDSLLAGEIPLFYDAPTSWLWIAQSLYNHRFDSLDEFCKGYYPNGNKRNSIVD